MRFQTLTEQWNGTHGSVMTSAHRLHGVRAANFRVRAANFRVRAANFRALRRRFRGVRAAAALHFQRLPGAAGASSCRVLRRRSISAKGTLTLGWCACGADTSDEHIKQ
jgi:hypothetical protein